MKGWRARLGFLVPPGNPTVETEMIELAPPGVSVHFHRMVARGATGSPHGQSERNRSMVAHLDDSIEMLAMVEPDVIVIAHTATSYHLGRQGEAELLPRLRAAAKCEVTTAFAAVLRGLEALNVRRLALGTPYDDDTTAQGRAHLEAHGIEVVSCINLKGIANIYETTPEHAYSLARQVDAEAGQAVFLSGTGMPTLPVLELLETDLGKPVLSSASAMMWHGLRLTGVEQPIPGYGRLLAAH